MPRPLRIAYEGAWYHVMNRGINHQTIFYKNADRELFLILLQEIVNQFQIEIHSYCLMDNHYHLLLKTPLANLSDAMRYLDGVYTQKFNRSNHRDGSLFRGRFKAILIENESYLLKVSRYIHLNPVIANLCKTPELFKWSSYASYIQKEYRPDWLSTCFLFSLLKTDNPRQHYIDFVLEGIDEPTSHFYNKQHYSSIMGDKKFIKDQLSSLNNEYIKSVATDVNHTIPSPSIEIILHIVSKHFQIEPNKLMIGKQGKQNNERMIAIYLDN